MIFPSTGEVSFTDGLHITAHATGGTVAGAAVLASDSARDLPVAGWLQVNLGAHLSNHGYFEVEVTLGFEGRVEAVFLSHKHPFYQPSEKDDPERRAFHDAVIATNLRGQREFSWGNVFCRFNRTSQRDWLVVIYTAYVGVALSDREVLQEFFAHEPEPKE